jgi:PIN domain nuclease of toxin-antitoxin system
VSRYLLDSHVVLWGLTAPRKLGRRTRDILENEDVYVSVLTVWELMLKSERKRLQLPGHITLARAIEDAGAKLLPLALAHVEEAAAIGLEQHDPIDRLLVGTARAERMVLLTRDSKILESAAAALGSLLLEA